MTYGSPVVDTSARLESVPEHIARYVPRHVSGRDWVAAGAGVRAAAQVVAVTLPTARVALPSLAAFGAWLSREGFCVDLDTLADADLIERFTQVGMPGRTEATRATRRATLRRAAARLRPEAPVPEAIAYRRARHPYSAIEVATYVEQAAAQPTAARRQSFNAILALGLGCGLHGQDLAWVRGIDVLRDGTVKVIGGPKPREVVVLDEHHDRLARCARAAGDSLIIGGTKLGRVNVTAPTLDRMLLDRSVPRVVPTRLRATWLVRHLNLRTPYSVLLPAAGLESSRTLDDLLPFADPIGGDEAADLLRGRAR